MIETIRSRHFSLMTYVSENNLKNYLNSEKFVKYAYIYHDKDDAEPHYHLILSFPNARTNVSILNKFEQFQGNTFIEVVHSESISNYLQHRDSEGVPIEGKHLYDISEIKSNCLKEFLDCSFINKNTAKNICSAILKGVSESDMLNEFGRDYVINYERYHKFADRLLKEVPKNDLSRLVYLEDRIYQYSLYLSSLSTYDVFSGKRFTTYISFDEFCDKYDNGDICLSRTTN